MSKLEARLAAIDARMAATMWAYAPWVNQPGERDAYEQMRADLAALQGPIARALELSRANRDAEASREMDLAAEQFSRVDQDFDRLVAINDQGATASLRRFSAIRRRLLLALLGMGLATLAATAVVGRWASRQVARREEAMSLDARILEARNRELDAFAGRVAHDIRGPLATISLATGRLAATVPQEREVTEILGRGVKRMETLVDDLLTLARVEAQIRGRCDPEKVVTQLQDDFSVRLSKEDGSLRGSLEHAEVACSESLLRQALTNLIDNAIKYRRPEVPLAVEVSGRAIGGGYELRVSDNGAGMSEDETARAFEPFYRSPRVLHLPGTGLGLSIVNRIAQASGGQLLVETSLGRGSTFIVRLALAAPGGADTQG
jgi:signal transduction histidine kinase